MSGTPNTNIKSISNNNNNNNDTSSNNNNNEPPEDPTFKFKYYIEKCYVLPLDLKNDIIYCQRAMRDFLKVHRLVSDVFKEQADADPVQMRRILDELQMEVHEINAEQQFLMLRLDQDLDAFYKKLEDNNIRTEPELGNAYISSLIVPLISDVNYKVCPQSVLTRDSEDMLIRKHFLIFQDDDTSTEPLKLSDLDDNVPLVLVDTTETTTTTSMASNSMPVDISIVKTEDQIEMPPPPPPPPLSSNLPTLKQKMAAKKVQQQQYQNPRMLPNKMKSAGVQALKPPPTPPPMPALVMRPSQTPAAVGRPRVPRLDAKQAAFKRISTALATQPPQPSPIAIDAVTPVAPSLSPSPSPTPKLPPGTILTKVPDTTKVPSTPPPPQPPAKSPPPAIVVPPATDFKEVAQSRMNLHQALQRARKTKHQPRKDVDDDIEVLTEQKVTTPPNNNNNSSKPTTVGKNKAGKAALEAAAPLATATATNKKTAQAAAATTKTYKTRNAQGTGRKTMTPPPPTPPPPPPPPMPPALANQQQHSSATAARAKLPMGSPGSSDEIHQDLELELEQQRLCASAAQWRDEPRESRVLPYEYGHENFLGLFGLYTHDMVKKLCQRHSKRKRRTVQNASGVDYHYGQQLSAIDAVRQKKLKEKPEFLLSPKVKRLQAKKAHKAAAAAANNNRKSKSKTPEKLAEATPAAVAAAAAALANCQPDVGKQKCKECKKRAENLLTCLSCHGHFHLECHEDVKPKTPQATLSSRCPPCLRVLQLSSTNSSSSSTGGGGGRGTRCVSN